jgi:hypothetical protein
MFSIISFLNERTLPSHSAIDHHRKHGFKCSPVEPTMTKNLYRRIIFLYILYRVLVMTILISHSPKLYKLRFQ